MMIRDQVMMAEPDVMFEDGRIVDVPGWDLQTVWTPGHSPGHVCFYSDRHKLLLSGDHVLPRITPNIGVHTQQFPNPLGEYLESLLKVQNLDVDEVLPAHEYRFADLHGRLDEIITHHADRLAEIERQLEEHPGSTAWDLSMALDLVAAVERDRRLHAESGRGRDRRPTSCSSRSTRGCAARGRCRPGTTSAARERRATADARRITNQTLLDPGG